MVAQGRGSEGTSGLREHVRRVLLNHRGEKQPSPEAKAVYLLCSLRPSGTDVDLKSCDVGQPLRNVVVDVCLIIPSVPLSPLADAHPTCSNIYCSASAPSSSLQLFSVNRVEKHAHTSDDQPVSVA